MTPDKRLGLVLVINAVIVVALVGVGLAANSLGVLASGADYLGDALGTGLSLAALRMSRHPHGHQGPLRTLPSSTQVFYYLSPWP